MWSQMNIVSNECGLQWMWSQMNVVSNACGLKCMWSQMKKSQMSMVSNEQVLFEQFSKERGLK